MFPAALAAGGRFRTHSRSSSFFFSFALELVNLATETRKKYDAAAHITGDHISGEGVGSLARCAGNRVHYRVAPTRASSKRASRRVYIPFRARATESSSYMYLIPG